MDYKEIQKAIVEYNNMSSQDVQEQIKPIIKSYNRKDLATKLGISKEALYTYCKTWFAKEDKKPQFAIYIGIMALGESKEPVKNNRGRKTLSETKRIQKTQTRKEKEQNKAVQKEKLKEYQHKYYMEVTKKKRAEKRMKRKVSN